MSRRATAWRLPRGAKGAVGVVGGDGEAGFGAGGVGELAGRGLACVSGPLGLGGATAGFLQRGVRAGV